jgi:hypothetical protein
MKAQQQENENRVIYDEDEEDEEKNLTYLEMLDNVEDDVDEEEYDESDYNEELNDSLYDSNFCQVNEILFV